MGIVDLKLKLEEKGWVLYENKLNMDEDSLLNFSKLLGTPVSSRKRTQFIDKLIPHHIKEANPKSLSALHGMGTFPLHTDTAHWKIPARFIILYAKKIASNSYPTVILDTNKLIFTEEIDELMNRGLFNVSNGRNSFLTTIKYNNKDFKYSLIRYDQGCMKPANRTGKTIDRIFNDILNKEKTEIINWNEGDLLIIDNWRCLHGRGETSSDMPLSNDRLLYRVNVMDNGGLK